MMLKEMIFEHNAPFLS